MSVRSWSSFPTAGSLAAARDRKMVPVGRGDLTALHLCCVLAGRIRGGGTTVDYSMALVAG